MKPQADMSSIREIVERTDSVILVDFDHTIFPSNSTEEFLLSARPRAAVSLLLGLTRDSPIWDYASMAKWGRFREYCAVVPVALLMPWNLLIWRHRAQRIFREFGNSPVAESLRGIQPNRIVIISFGFRLLLRPLLQGSPWESSRCIAMPMVGSYASLFYGKRRLAIQTIGEIPVREAVFITDSLADRDLLDFVKYPFLVAPAGSTGLAEDRLYFPLRYSRRGKFSNAYVIDQFVMVDLVILLIACQPLPNIRLGIAAAAVAFWLSLLSVYELGYAENDSIAAQYEEAPDIAPSAERLLRYWSEWAPWRWALAIGMLGVASVSYAGKDLPIAWPATWISRIVLWLLILLGVRLTFWVYNRSHPLRRVMIYPALQGLKYFGPLALLGMNAVGACLLSSQIFAMWIGYLLYKIGGKRNAISRDHLRLVAFGVWLAGLALAGVPVWRGPAGATTLVASVWCVWRILPNRVRRAASAPLRRGVGLLGRVFLTAFRSRAAGVG